MAKELRHKDVIAGRIREVEYEHLRQHILDGQAIGDMVYASSASQLSGLLIGSTGDLLTVTAGKPAWTSSPDLTGKLTAGSQASPVDVTAIRQYGVEIHYSGNNYNVTAIRARAQLVTTDTTASAQGAVLQGANNDGIDAGVVQGALIEAIGKSSSVQSTISYMRGALIGCEWSAKDIITTLKTLHVRTHTRDAATEGYVSGTSYAIHIENEAVGGNGQTMDAAIRVSELNMGGGTKSFGTLLDASGAGLTLNGAKVTLLKFKDSGGTERLLIHDTGAATVLSVEAA